LRHRDQREVRAESDPWREDLPQALQLLTLGAEHRAQDDVERDPHHRGHRREGLIGWPPCELVDRFALDDCITGGQPPASERRREQFALRAVLVTGQREHRIRAHDSAEVGVGRVRDVRSRFEQPANIVGFTDDNQLSEDG